MVNSKFIALAVIFGALGHLFGGCAWTQIQTTVTHPAEINLGPWKKIAVWGINGPDGSTFASQLSSALAQTGRFEVVDSGTMERLIRDRGLTSSEALFSNENVEWGELLVASAVLEGDTRIPQPFEDLTYEDIVIPIIDPVTNQIQNITQRHYTRVAEVSIEVTFKITDYNKGSIIHSKAFTAERRREETSVDAEPASINTETMLRECRYDVVQKFMQSIAPWDERINVLLFQGDGTFELFGSFPEWDLGIKFAANGQWQDALHSFNEALTRYQGENAPDSHLVARAWYNVGVAQEYLGFFDEALGAFTEANKAEASDTFFEERKHCEQLKLDAERLAEQEASFFGAN
ncbi:MAG: tetratricopeptide repeat protein [Planctomycetes bacterium]|nr:tetratricopeptide repeat protein [Planctomycetota bacterium]